MIHRSIILPCLQFVAIAFFATTVQAQSKTDTQPPTDDLILATVGDYPIRLSQVDRQVAKVVGKRKLTDQQRKEIRLESLTHLVNRELVSAYLVDRGFEVGKSQIKLEVDLLSAKLDQVGTDTEKPEGALPFVIAKQKFHVVLPVERNIEEECARLRGELEYHEGFIQNVMKKLGNERFVQNAPEAVVAMERKKLADGE